MHARLGIIIFFCLSIVLVWYSPFFTSKTATASITYTNTTYGFRFDLPKSWEGYRNISDAWQGYAATDRGDSVVEKGPLVILRHPQWSTSTPRQDIPIMVFTLPQWDALRKEAFHVGAAPIGPTELGRNTRYVFALPARYNFAFPAGYEEVEHILERGSLHAF